MRIVLIGYGHVGRAFSELLAKQRSVYPFPIVGIHTRHGTAINLRGLDTRPQFDTPLPSVEQFLETSRPDVAVEVTTLNPETGEPALSHIRAAFTRGIHVITANKGPIAHAYAALRDEARLHQVEFRFESTVMDGTPIFNNLRNNLPGTKIMGFAGVLNSTSKVVVAAMQNGSTMEQGILEARRLGITEADASFDIDGWDSAAKTVALANVLMDARLTPQAVAREGIGGLTTHEAVQLAQSGRTVALISRGARKGSQVELRVKPEVISGTDLLAAAQGTSNLLLLHTDLMGTLGIISIDPGVEQTAYGLFADLVDVAKSL